jgi:hypothetical protein
MRKHRIMSLGVGGVAVLLASCANADSPNDLLPSSLRTVTTSSDACFGGSPLFGVKFDLRQHPDGTRSAFSVGTGQVLVITAAEISGSGGVAGNIGDLGVEAFSSFVPQVSSFLFGQTNITMDSGGNMSRQYTFPTGVVVKSGVTLCAIALDVKTVTPLTVFGVLHGYLAADK